MNDDNRSMDDLLDGESDRRVEPSGRLSLGPLAPGTYVIELQGAQGRRQERIRIVDRDVYTIRSDSDSVRTRHGSPAMAEVIARALLKTPLVSIRDVQCEGRCRHHSDEESTNAVHMVFPYRGIYVRHLGETMRSPRRTRYSSSTLHEGYRVSHPVPGGDASLDLVVSEPILDELSPRSLLREIGGVAFRSQRLRIDPRAQALAALLRHSLRTNIAEPLEAESLALTLARRALGPRTAHTPAASAVRQRLVNRTKVILASDLTRRWTLAEIAAEVGHSPVYSRRSFSRSKGCRCIGTRSSSGWLDRSISFRSMTISPR